MKTTRIEGLDTLRALAIALVFMHHYALFASGESSFGIFSDLGWAGVDLFFALSGYLIGNQIFAAMGTQQGFSLPRFYGRRFLRTLPNYYVLLALYACWPWFRAGADLPEIWRFLSFTQNWNLNPGTAFSHAWSLCIEEQFYVLLPAIAMLKWPRQAGWLLAVGAIGLGMWIRSKNWINDEGSNHYFRTIYYSSLCRFDELVAGVALAMLKNYHPRIWERASKNGNELFAAGLVVTAATFYFSLQDRFSYTMTVFGFPALAAGFALLIAAALSPTGLLRHTRIPGAASLALWSYAIYLTHKQLCILAAKHLGGTDKPLTMLGVAVASIASGWLLYALVETPFMRLRERWLPTNLRQ